MEKRLPQGKIEFCLFIKKGFTNLRFFKEIQKWSTTVIIFEQADTEYRSAAEAIVYKRRLERAEGKLVSCIIVLVSKHSVNKYGIIFCNFI